MTRITIGEAASRYGVTIRALRFYEEAGLLAPTRQKGRRVFEDDDCRRLEAVLGAKKLGFSLAEIRQSFFRFGLREGQSSIADSLFPDQIRRQIDLLEAQRNEIDEAIMTLRDALGNAPQESMTREEIRGGDHVGDAL